MAGSESTLADRLKTNHNEDAGMRDNEFRCDECHVRCTNTPNLGEVGHCYDCPRRDRYRGTPRTTRVGGRWS